MCVPERDFSDVIWAGKENRKEKKKKAKPTGIKTQVPADTVKQINQLMKWVCNSHAQTRKFSEQV